MGSYWVEAVLVCGVCERDLLSIRRAVGEPALRCHRRTLGARSPGRPALVRRNAVGSIVAETMINYRLPAAFVWL